jgi:amidase
MTLPPPTPEALAALAARLGLGIDATDLETYYGASAGLLGSWEIVDRLYAAHAPVPPARAWQEPADNPLGAWYVTTDIPGAADGLLAGKSVAVKDNIAVAGVPMMNGSATLAGFVPSSDATVVTRLLAAGATIKGKSACEDLCFSGGSHTNKAGPIRNPWDRERSAGGSSSGSAALVASGEVDLALGGDQGGSVRIPSSFCGTVGHKPTFGLVPYTGAFPIEQTIDHLGPITRTVADAALLLSVLAGPDGLDPRQAGGQPAVDYLAGLELSGPLRIGVVTEGFQLANSNPAVSAVVRGTLQALAAAGHLVEEVSIPWHRHGSAIWDVISVEGATWQMVQGNGYGLNWKGRYDPELMSYYGHRWRADPSAFSETVKLVALAGTYALDTAYGSYYAKARNLESQLTQAYDEQLAQFDVLAMPTLPITASLIPPADAPVADVLGRALEMIANTAPFDVTGHPACSVPAGLAGGLPVGLMLIGKHFDDAGVLRAARCVESTVGTLSPLAPVTKEISA